MGDGVARNVLRKLPGIGAVLFLVLGLLAMPFLQPSAHAATVSDNFNRANGGLGSNWTTVSGTTAPQIVNNTAQPGSAGTLNSAYWSANTFGSNQYAAASFPNSSGTNYGPAIAVRLEQLQGLLPLVRQLGQHRLDLADGQFLELDPAQGQREAHHRRDRRMAAPGGRVDPHRLPERQAGRHGDRHALHHRRPRHLDVLRV